MIMKKKYVAPKISFDKKEEGFNFGVVAIVAVLVWHVAP